MMLYVLPVDNVFRMNVNDAFNDLASEVSYYSFIKWSKAIQQAFYGATSNIFHKNIDMVAFP